MDYLRQNPDVLQAIQEAYSTVSQPLPSSLFGYRVTPEYINSQRIQALAQLEDSRQQIAQYHRNRQANRVNGSNRRTPRCGLCDTEGHNRRTCPFITRTTRPTSQPQLPPQPPPQPPPPQPPKRETLPKHISKVVAETTETTCQICLTELDGETLCLSKCGHNFCDTCLNDTRLTQCGVCRNAL